MTDLTQQDEVAIRAFMEALDAGKNLDLPEFKELARQEARKLSPAARRFVHSVFVEVVQK